ncbi:MAG: DUF3798 domain-containing protein [Defluviitaleaceae bacterium]|nr:DUF3798 domain-containing protein [Defluviitaleaceae bacterium]
MSVSVEPSPPAAPSPITAQEPTPVEPAPLPQYSQPAVIQSAVAVSAASSHTLALMEDGSLWQRGVHSPWPQRIKTNVTQAVAGHYHSLAITRDGGLWALGMAIGDGTEEFRPSPVRIMDDVIYATMTRIVPNSHTFDGVRSYVIRADGSLWAWGLAAEAFSTAIGDGSLREDRLTPVQIMEDVIAVTPTSGGGFAITSDNTLWGWHGDRFYHDAETGEWLRTDHQLTPAPIMENIGYVHGHFAITTDGELWRVDGQPEFVMNDIAYATGGSTAFAITTGGHLLAWGNNRLPYQWRAAPPLGDGTTIDRENPVIIMENVASITVIGNTAYAITNCGQLWGWGSNNGWGSGIIGDGSIFSHDYVTDDMFEYALDDEHIWGLRWLGGDGSHVGLRLSPVKILENVTAVAASYYMFDHGWIQGFRSFAVTDCGAIWAWGENDRFGQGWSFLGDGTSERRLAPVRIISGCDYRPSLPTPDTANHPAAVVIPTRAARIHNYYPTLPGKIAVITTERIHDGDNWIIELTERHGPENILVYTWPPYGQLTAMDNVIDAIATNPAIGVLIISPAQHQTDRILAEIRQRRGDIFIIHQGCQDTNLFIEFDMHRQAAGLPATAQQLGASTLAFFYDSLFPADEEFTTKRIMHNASAEIGLNFVEIDIYGYIQCGSSHHMFMQDNLPPLIERHGRDIVFVGLGNERLFWDWRDSNVIYLPLAGSQWFEPTLVDLAYELHIIDEDSRPADGVYDIPYVIDAIRQTLEYRGQLGRIATLPMPQNLLFHLAAAEYAIAWMNRDAPRVGVDEYLLAEIIVGLIEEFAGIPQHAVEVTADGGRMLVWVDYFVFR